MPKVHEGHYEQKRQQILAAARRVCERKPLYSVTMKDIVVESGMSQGGVYKYYSSIDAVFVSLLNEASLSSQVETDVELILAAGPSPWQTIDDLLHYLGRYIQGTVQGSGELYFELMTLYANEPARFMAIKDQLVEVSALEYLQKQLHQFIEKGAAETAFVPVVPLEDLVGFISTSLNGIAQALISSRRLTGMPEPNAERLVDVLARSVKVLLGGSATTT